MKFGTKVSTSNPESFLGYPIIVDPVRLIYKKLDCGVIVIPQGELVLWVFVGSTPGEGETLPRGTETMASGATGGAIEDGHALCGSTESRTENGAEGGETKRLDLGGDVAAR